MKKRTVTIILFIAALIAIDSLLSSTLNSHYVILLVIASAAAFLAYRSLKKTAKPLSQNPNSTKQVKKKAQTISRKDALIIDSLNGIKNHIMHLSSLLDNQSQQNKKGNPAYLMNDMIMDSLLIMSTNDANAYIIQEKKDNAIHKYQENIKLKKLQHLFKRKGQRLNVLRAKNPKFQANFSEPDFSKEDLTLDFPGNLINFN